MKGHDRHDVDALRLDTIREAEGTRRIQKTPEPAAKPRAGGRTLEQSFVPPLNREDEVQPEPNRLALVEIGCRNELVLCLGMTINAFSPKRGTSPLDDLPGKNPDDLSGLELAQATLRLRTPELLSIRICSLIEAREEALREAGAVPARELQGL